MYYNPWQLHMFVNNNIALEMWEAKLEEERKKKEEEEKKEKYETKIKEYIREKKG